MKNNYSVKVKNIKKSFKVPLAGMDTIRAYLTDPFSKKRHRTFSPLKDISFDVKKGEFFSVIGPNGVGKSTLLKLLSGIYEQDEGEIEVNGNLVPFLELGVGFSPDLTAKENVFLNGILLGLTRKQVEKNLDDIFDFAGLDEFRDMYIKQFSSGMYVRLAFSVAVKIHSDILVLDEVLAVGDLKFQRKCYNYFDEIKGKRTIVFVSHDLESVKRYSDRVMYLRKDHSYEIGDPEEIVSKYVSESNED